MVLRSVSLCLPDILLYRYWFLVTGGWLHFRWLLVFYSSVGYFRPKMAYQLFGRCTFFDQLTGALFGELQDPF